MEETLTLSTVGLSSKDHTVLKSLFALVERDLEQSWQLSPEAEGDILLVDVDTDDGRSLWGRLSGSDGLKCAALTRNRSFTAPFLLHKPLRSKQLLQLLNEYALASYGEAEEGAWHTLVVSHKPDFFALAEHLRRRSWNGAVLLRRVGAADLVLDPGSGSWYSDAELHQLVPYLIDEIGVHEAYPLGNRDLLEFSRTMQRHSLLDLQWFAGLSVGGGQLHPDIKPADRVGIMRVPQQAKANATHKAIAEQLIGGPRTPDQLVTDTRVTIDEVARFLNACLYCGWLIIDSQQRFSA